MSYSVVVAKSAKKDISKLTPMVQKRIKQKIIFYAAQKNPLEFASPLSNSKDGQYRWRIGTYRVIFDVSGSIIAILKVQHRKDVYRSK